MWLYFLNLAPFCRPIYHTSTRVQIFDTCTCTTHMLCTHTCTRTHCHCTRTWQMRSKLPDADISALIFLKCNDMSCVWHACTLTSTRPNCLLSHCKHETISRVWVFNSVSNVFVFWSKRRFMYDLQLHLYSQILCSYLRVMYSYSRVK